MPYLPKRSWKLKGFKRSKRKGKKYDAVLQHKTTGAQRTMSFGAIKSNGKPYPQYRDSTNLGLYRKLDHGDKERRRRYRARHRVYIKPGMWSPGWLAWRYLW
jgi:hypothetical protein